MIKISKSYPLPKKEIKGGNIIKYPFKFLKVGDSFFVKKTNIQMNCYRTYWQSKTGFKFTVRKVKNGTRIWRIK